MTAQMRAAVVQARSAECKKQVADQVEWVPSGWDDPRAIHLRSLMDEELRPRYAPLEAAGRPRPQQPSSGDIEVVWIALIGGEPAATAALLRNPGYWEVKRVFVATEFRRRALARKALALVEDSARAAGAHELVLQTGILQPDAIRLYTTQGWSRTPNYGPYAEDEASLCFHKFLTDKGTAEGWSSRRWN